MSKSLSIIIPCLNEGNSLEKMIPNINNTIGLDDIKDYEIIVINSGGTETEAIRDIPMVYVYTAPTRLGAPQARNFGANIASGKFIMFADAHMEFKEGFGPKILKNLEDNENSIIAPCITVMGHEQSSGCGLQWININMESEWLSGTKPAIHEIPFAGGACIAVEKKIFDKIGQFDSGISFFEDVEISIRAWLLGFNILCDPLIKVAHAFRKYFPYDVEWLDIYSSKMRIAFSHFSSKRLTAHLRAMYNTCYDFNKILLMNIEDKVLDRRRKLFNERTYTDDWFFEKFPMTGI